jgi:DNA-binding MarR family transcriptional regulator
MASKSSRMARLQRRTAQLRPTDLQKFIVQRLYDHLHPPQEAETQSVPYTKLVEALAADKVRVTTTLRQMMRQGLVEITLPRGGWTRCVRLTEKGKAYAQALPKKERRSRWQTYADEAAEYMWGEKRWRLAAKRRDRDPEERQKRDERRIRRRSKREPW